MEECIACGIVNGKQQATIVYQDELVCSFMDIDPINDGHVLIVPKRHLKDVDNLTDNEILAVMKTAQLILKVFKKIYKIDGYSMMQNGGSCDELNHYHMHIFPRYNEDGFSWNWPAGEMQDVTVVGQKIRNLIQAEKL